jgi:hypothetical protein
MTIEGADPITVTGRSARRFVSIPRTDAGCQSRVNQAAHEVVPGNGKYR